MLTQEKPVSTRKTCSLTRAEILEDYVDLYFSIIIRAEASPGRAPHTGSARRGPSSAPASTDRRPQTAGEGVGRFRSCGDEQRGAAAAIPRAGPPAARHRGHADDRYRGPRRPVRRRRRPRHSLVALIRPSHAHVAPVLGRLPASLRTVHDTTHARIANRPCPAPTERRLESQNPLRWAWGCFIYVSGAQSATMRDIRYKWNEGPNSVGVSSEVSLPQFKVLGHRQRAMEISLTTGNYSRLACEIQFVRSMGYYLIQIYIPSGLIVIISWVSFWLNRNATPARVALGVTTVLTMTTLMSSTNAALPKISYVKSIDRLPRYLLRHGLRQFTRIQMRKQRFVAIQKIASEKKIPVECPPVGDPHLPKMGTLSRCPPGRPSEVRFKVHDPKAHQKEQHWRIPLTVAEVELKKKILDLLHTCSTRASKLLGMTPSDIDKYSRIVFPVCFVCFNLMYWIIYLHVSDVVADDLVLLEEDK
ncbi:Gamma-aminobutyric acid receptor subunit beta [Eumeta japonica]|uniref:Gamma-aminobutyric acid receptor subunit beta n=1 Tax=Eumeta variegata TaxID=151549 RepID=A0A4C1ZXH8_EUMVA|nr:Gamma-aminobutyric acid receptor subunit beta [Eumeta japonica]